MKKNANLFAHFQHHFPTDLNAPLLVTADDREVSYAQADEASSRVATCLLSMGAAAGDRITVQVEKSVENLFLYLGCLRAGLVYHPLNTAYTASELEYFLNDAEPTIIVCDSNSVTIIESVIPDIGLKALLTLNADGTGSLMEHAKNAFETVDRDVDDLAAFLYTSGTTGRSKGAMLTQGNLLSNAETLADYWCFTDRDVLLNALPIFHTHGLFVATNITLIAGGSMIFLPKFDLDQVLQHLPHASTMMGVPTFYTRLLGDGRFDRELVDHMRLFVSGSAPLLSETHDQFVARTGHRILERYGMTETNMNTSNPYEGARRAGTVGMPLPGVELKITNAISGETLPDGETGQIEVRGPNVFKGYWQMPEKTREELRENGFFITGDLGLIDAEGYVQIVGRNKDLIISGGYNIYPKEIEILLDDQPAVLESAVIGVPHSDFGETVVGFLVAQEGCQPDLEAISEKDVIAHCKTRLANFKIPKKVEIVDALPRNAMGKVQKNLLRDRFGK